ncbi:MAG TPA: radical SAM protein [Candidatus Omnitrophota bacterium]|nr:radical SAM protein [Candidatus Omnitrophota bacterium]
MNSLPRLPLEGGLDLSYRCNNNCRHCWLRIPASAKEKKRELSFEEIKKIVNQARQMGARKWFISGGEPMLRPDFCEIFNYLTSAGSDYSINTNGTLITPKIAKLMVRKGVKMVALYGATAKLHDYITRHPGSFEATLRGFRYLKEAHAGFVVQLIPMKDNYHEFKAMVRLAESLSKYYRIGAPWLYLSANADKKKNAEIICQRLPPKEVISLEKPSLFFEEWLQKEQLGCCQATGDRYLFSSCINNRRDFHIDPYGQMSFCCFIKDPGLRYDLKNGSFQDCWDNFIPSLAIKLKATQDYKDNCGSCKLKNDCRFCPAYGYLEHGDFNKKIGYLCAVAKANRKFKEEWQKNHRRYFKIADITVQVEFDLPVNERTFHPKFKPFQVKGPGKDNISIRHYFSLPPLTDKDLGRQVYRKLPWAIYKKNESWVYRGISPLPEDNSIKRISVFNLDHTRAKIYRDSPDTFLAGNLLSLTLFPSDQLLLARILTDRDGCYLHSCGVNFMGKGLLFVGHSGAGKSTMAMLLKNKAKILCDDRNIIRKQSGVFKVYGTWSHGDVSEVSAQPAPLTAILFLNKSKKNYLKRMRDKKKITSNLLAYLIRPFVTVDWWEKSLAFLESVSNGIPCYELYFDKSGKVIELLKQL